MSVLDNHIIFNRANPIRFKFFKFVEFVQRVIPKFPSVWRGIGDSLSKVGFSSVALVQIFQNDALFDNKRLHCYATELPDKMSKIFKYP